MLTKRSAIALWQLSQFLVRFNENKGDFLIFGAQRWHSQHEMNAFFNGSFHSTVPVPLQRSAMAIVPYVFAFVCCTIYCQCLELYPSLINWPPHYCNYYRSLPGQYPTFLIFLSRWWIFSIPCIFSTHLHTLYYWHYWHTNRLNTNAAY